MGEPETVIEAGTMLGALRKVRLGMEPLPGAEAEIVQTVREFMNGPPGHQPAGSNEEEIVDQEAIAMAVTSETTATKRCTKCGEDKPLAAFTRDKKTRDGLSYRCKDCKRQERKAREQSTADVPDERSNLVTLRAALESTQAEAEPEQPDNETRPDGESWRTLFENPTLMQLETLRSFLGEVTMDEVVQITRSIARAS